MDKYEQSLYFHLSKLDGNLILTLILSVLSQFMEPNLSCF